jgi:hypothetical protein
LQENNYNFRFDQLKVIEESVEMPLLYGEAKAFLHSHNWCKKVIKVWYEEDLSILDKLGVFLFEIEPINDEVDSYIWVIVGDLPAVYLDASVQTGKEALKTYCDLMEEWADNVLQCTPLEESYPVEAKPNRENAEHLKKRTAFIRRELLIEEH